MPTTVMLIPRPSLKPSVLVMGTTENGSVFASVALLAEVGELLPLEDSRDDVRVEKVEVCEAEDEEDEDGDEVGVVVETIDDVAAEVEDVFEVVAVTLVDEAAELEDGTVADVTLVDKLPVLVYCKP